jgi:hypothetical protein
MKVLNNFKTMDNSKIFSIINTANYCGDMGVLVVEGYTDELEDFGFGEEDIKEIDKLNIGASWVSDEYGVGGCVVVRMK